MVFVETVIGSKCMICARSGDGKSLKNRSGNPGQEKQCIQVRNSYHPDIDNPKGLRHSNRSLIYNEPSDSFFYFTKSSVAAATNTSTHTHVHKTEAQRVYQVMPKAEIKSTLDNISPDLGRFSYNWVDTTPAVVSVMRSIDFANADKSKSDSSTETFNVKKRKCVKLNRTKICRNFKLNKINLKNRRKNALASKSKSASSCEDSLQSAMNNLCGFFEDLLQTTLSPDPELDTAIKDEPESSSLSSWSRGGSIDTIVDSESVPDDIALKKRSIGTIGWDFMENSTSTSIMTNFVNWDNDNDSGHKRNKLVFNMTSTVDKPQWSRPTTATSKESSYTEINVSSFVNLRRKSDASKRKRSYVFPSLLKVPLKKDANRYDSPKKFKPRSSHKKRIISYLKKRLSDGDKKDRFNNGPQSEFFKSLKNIAFLKSRLSKEQRFFGEPKANASNKHKCWKGARKYSKGNGRGTSAKGMKHNVK